MDPLPAPAVPQPVDPLPEEGFRLEDPLHTKDSSDDEWPFPVEAQGSPEWEWFEQKRIQRQEEAMALDKAMADGRQHDSV